MSKDLPIFPEWQLRRSELNHNWLKNRYLNRMSAAIQRLRNAGPGRKLALSFFVEDFREWEDKRGEANWLVENFEVQMSPKVLFDREPLSNVDAATKEWLPDLIHTLWVSRYRISSMLKNINTAMSVMERKYTCISRMEPWKWMNLPEDMHPFLDLMEEFEDACKGLSTSLSALPKDILCT